MGFSSFVIFTVAFIGTIYDYFYENKTDRVLSYNESKAKKTACDGIAELLQKATYFLFEDKSILELFKLRERFLIERILIIFSSFK